MKKLRQILQESDYAAKDGESEIVHHATPHEFARFRPFSHFGTAAAARSITQQAHRDFFGSEPDWHYHSARLKLGNVVHMPDSENDHTVLHLAHELHKAGHISQEERDSVVKHNWKEGRASLQLANVLRNRNIHTISYKNEIEDPGSTSYIITHPNQVRHLRSGRFIPNKKGSRSSP